jgi:hypothetical protein
MSMWNKTAYIVPALTDIGGQCRIVMCDGFSENARDEYEASPDHWWQIGLMNFDGKVVCIDDPTGPIAAELRACEPLMAGLQFHFRGPL